MAILCTPGHDFVVALLACWQAGAIAVPLHPPAPGRRAALRVAGQCRGRRSLPRSPTANIAYGGRLYVRGVGVVDVDATAGGLALAVDAAADQPAMMLYTSGTTGRPKGVVLTHGNLGAQVEALGEAWGVDPDERSCSCCRSTTSTASSTCAVPARGRRALRGARRFDAGAIWERLAPARSPCSWPCRRSTRRRGLGGADETTRDVVGGSARACG